MAMLAMGGESMIPTSIPMIEVPDPEWDEWTPRCVVDEPDGPYEPRSGGTIWTSLPPHLQKLVEDLEREDDEESSFPWDEEFPPEDLDRMLTEVKCKLEAMYSASLDVNDNTSVGVVPALDVTTADEPPPLQPEPPQLRLTPPPPPEPPPPLPPEPPDPPSPEALSPPPPASCAPARLLSLAPSLRRDPNPLLFRRLQARSATAGSASRPGARAPS